MENTTLQTRFEKLDVGARIEVYTPIAMYSGILEEADDSGIVVSWRYLEWQVVNGKFQEMIMTKYQFISYESILSFAILKP